MSTQPITPQSPSTTNMLDHAMLLVVTRTWIPMTKTISNRQLKDSTAEQRMISTTKKLFDCPELKRIQSNQVKVDEFLKRRSSPVPLKKGHHLVAEDLFHEVEAQLLEFYEEHVKLVDAFAAVYVQAVEDAKNLLGSEFNPGDYPSLEQVKGYFHFSWDYLQFGISDKLKEINKEVAERKEQQFQSQVVKAGEAASALLLEQFQKIMNHLVDRLTPVENEEGELKRKVFRDNMLEPITDFLAVVDPRNLGGNEQLKSLTDKVKALMNGVSVASLKENDGQRLELEKSLSEIKGNIDKMVIDHPIRAFQFEEV